MSICRRSVFTRPRRTPLRCQQLSISSRVNSHRKIVWKCGATAFCPVSGFSSAHSITARHSGFGSPRALHFSFYVAVEVPEICPRLFFGFRAIFRRIGLRCVGVFLGEVGIYQLAEQPPGVFGVLVLLCLRRSAQVGSPCQLLVQRSALLCSVHGVDFDFLVVRGAFYLCRTGSGAHVEKDFVPILCLSAFPGRFCFR